LRNKQSEIEAVKKQTLKSKSPSFFFSIASGFIVFAILLALLEGVSRSKYASHIFPLRSVGSYHAQFEIKWFALQDFVKENKGVDVVLIGNSMVNTGIDPVEFKDRYQQLSGQHLRVFNFGVDGLTIESLSVIAELINTHYHPGTIILFTEMRDYIAGNGSEVAKQFVNNRWMDYQRGIPSLEGYLIENSALLKYLLPYRNWSNSDFLDSIRMEIYRKSGITAQGYEADHNLEPFSPVIPDPADPAEQPKFKLAANFAIDPSRALNLQEVISLNTTGTHIIVTEMPVYPTYFVYFGPSSVREKYLQDLAALILSAGGQFVPAVPEEKIPIGGRVDDHHLNYKGAPIYSELLANQLFTACEQESTCLYPASPENQP